jgi:caspase domain-containing protein
MEGAMSNATSLTDAVKAAATQGASLTDAIKEAARSGTDSTIVTFPRLAFEARHETMTGVGAPRAAAAGLHAPASAAHAPQRERIPELPAEEDLPPAPFADSKPGRPSPLRLQPRAATRLRPPAGIRRLTLPRGSVPGGKALRAIAGRARRAAARLAGVAALTLLALVVMPSPVGPDKPLAAATQQKRVALVIGNSAYRFTRRLDNPRHDATDVGSALKRLGFQVIEGFDLDKAGLDEKIRLFTTHLRGASVGVFFYAGHGLHIAGQNYLIPVDAQLAGAPALDLELVRLDLVHRTMEREAPTNILFFDACRDGPLPDTLARAMGTRPAQIGRGLATVQSGAGTLISFSTQPGTIALDGNGRNSPYSAALARQLAASHEDLGAMLIAIRNDVMKETDGRQVPWEHSALMGRFYFNPAAAEAGGPRASTAAPSTARDAFEAWSLAMDTTNLTVLKAFIARYGDTFYAELARARIAELRRQGIATTTPPSVAELAPSFDR